MAEGCGYREFKCTTRMINPQKTEMEEQKLGKWWRNKRNGKIEKLEACMKGKGRSLVSEMQAEVERQTLGSRNGA